MAITAWLIGTALVAAIVIMLTKLVQLIINHKKTIDIYRPFPQRPSHFLFGHMLEYPGPNDMGLAFQRAQIEEFPRMHLGWIGQTPLVFVTHPDLVKIILKSSDPKSVTYRFLHPWLGQGLLTSNKSKWLRNRRLLTPAFHFDILRGYVLLKNKLCRHLLSKFESAAQSGDSLKVFANISMFTLDVMLQSTMSYETGCQQQGENNPYIQAVDRLNHAVVDRFMKPWMHPDIVFFLSPLGRSFVRDCDCVHEVADQIITKRRKELESVEKADNQRRHHDFLDTLLTARDENGTGLTNREIRDEVDTFLFEGHDTTASAISWCLYSIAEHGNIQGDIQTELDLLLHGREKDDILWDDLSQLPYLTKVIKESMRLHCPVPMVMRELTQPAMLDGCVAPQGATAVVNIYNVHHNDAVWPDCMKFDPERFSKENVERRDPFAFVPFSAGPRNCIGQNFAMEEIKIALARILNRYSISLDPSHTVTKFNGMVMKAEHDIKLLVKTRPKSTLL